MGQRIVAGLSSGSDPVAGPRFVVLAGISPMGRLALLLALLFCLHLLSACSTPTRAKVVSRDVSTKSRQVKHRPATYRVRRGDTLYSIAWRYGLDFPSLAAWNGIRSPYRIYPGQRLRLTRPARKKKNAPARHKKSTAQSRPRTTVSQKKSAPGKPRARTSSAKGNNAAAGAALHWRWPADGRVRQRYVPGKPDRKGIKVSGRRGQPVFAAEGGRVVYAGSGLIGYGRLVIIKHNKNYLSAYGHNRKLLVKEGEQVKRGQQIAQMGTDGSGVPMLHFEIRRNGKPVNPLRLLPRR